MSQSDVRGRIVRVLIYGKGLEAIEPEIVNAIHNGNQVLVNAACASDTVHARPDENKTTIGDWAEALSQKHGLGWRRVGLDVLFTRSNS